jgi:hypothetical protein
VSRRGARVGGVGEARRWRLAAHVRVRRRRRAVSVVLRGDEPRRGEHDGEQECHRRHRRPCAGTKLLRQVDLLAAGSRSDSRPAFAAGRSGASAPAGPLRCICPSWPAGMIWSKGMQKNPQ